MRRPHKNTKEYKKVKRNLLSLYLESDRLLRNLKIAISSKKEIKKEITNRLDNIFFLAIILEKKLVIH